MLEVDLEVSPAGSIEVAYVNNIAASQTLTANLTYRRAQLFVRRIRSTWPSSDRRYHKLAPCSSPYGANECKGRKRADESVVACRRF